MPLVGVQMNENILLFIEHFMRISSLIKSCVSHITVKYIYNTLLRVLNRNRITLVCSMKCQHSAVQRVRLNRKQIGSIYISLLGYFGLGQRVQHCFHKRHQ